ncbi:MAG TPA: peptidoglycan editing factor PgeF [Streptosporangiaceae bacterium]
MTWLAPAGPGDRPWRQFEIAAGVGAMFTTRHGGASGPPYDTLNLSAAVGDRSEAVSRNRELLRQRCGPASQPVSWLRQVHGTTVREAPAAGPEQEADAQFTSEPGLPLGVLAADCAIVLAADSGARVIGAAHAGRAGLMAGVVPGLLAAMAGAGAVRSRISVAVGPVICGACYEVPAGLRAEADRAVPGSGCTTRRATPGIDIRAGLRAQLAAAGVAGVTFDHRCTAESPELYSYRRDGTTGRFAGVIWLTS